MPAFWSEAVRMTTSGLLVASVAVPVGLVARALRPRGEPLLPRWKPWRVPWGGFEVTFAFLIGSQVLPVLVLQFLSDGGFYQAVYGADFPSPLAEDSPREAKTVGALWASLLALPLQLGMLWVVSRALYPSWKPEFVGRGSFAGKVWLAVLAWLAFTPTVLVFNAAVNGVYQSLFGVPPEQHTLTQLGARPPLDRVLLVLQACVCAPVWEEVFFRGVLLAWCVGRMKLPGVGVAPMTAARPWFVMAAAVALTVLMSGGRTGPIAFAAVLAIGLGLVWRLTPTGARRARAIYATAALFALGHAAWPTPIPLFLLGLGLGWLAVRTNGVLVPILVHALFNAVSVVSVLRA